MFIMKLIIYNKSQYAVIIFVNLIPVFFILIIIAMCFEMFHCMFTYQFSSLDLEMYFKHPTIKGIFYNKLYF